MIWFATLVAWRYFRFFVLLFYFWRYKPAGCPPDRDRTFGPDDVTIIITTISVSSNPYFEECVTTALVNTPAAVLIVTDTRESEVEIDRRLENIPRGASVVQVMHVGLPNKRVQMARGFRALETTLAVCMDDHVFLPPRFLEDVILPFEQTDKNGNPRIGLCGTKKSVRRYKSSSSSLWQRYWEDFWNVMGALYLT
jgi:hypothetical protein